MNNTVRQLCINLGVTFVTLVVLALFFEFVLFRYVLVAADLPQLDASGPAIKYRPDQKGTYRLRNEIKADFSINDKGWNSGRNTYVAGKTVPRIAVVGDSYIAALQVDFEASVAERLEALGNGAFEVYRFGMSGAPLSQYLHMLREEVLPYKPDLVIFNVVHNDFAESYDFKAGAYTSAFLKLKMNGDRVAGEIPPLPYSPRWFEPIRQSNTWRYLGVRQQVRFQNLRNLLLGSDGAAVRIEANINAEGLEGRQARDVAATEYVLGQAKRLCEANGARFMVVMDGVRQLIYANPAGPYDRSTGALALNDVISRAARELSIPCIDLHDIFAAHYREHGRRFEFPHDGHWNELGHTVAAKAIFRDLQSRSAIPGLQ